MDINKDDTIKDNKPITERIKSLEETLDKEKKIKTKKFRLPGKGKVSNVKLKKGYVSIICINDNKEVSFVKAPIVGSTIKLEKEYLSYHSIDPKDIYTYKGKPFVMIYKGKLNPYNPFEGRHETYGQEYVSARMFSDQIKLKKSMGWLGWVVGAGILAIIVFALLSKGGHAGTAAIPAN